jgi:hypothetical protein
MFLYNLGKSSVMGTVEIERKSKHPTVLRTFRLSKSLDDALTKDASRKKIGKNALVVSVLNKYVEWDSAVSDFGYVTVPGEMIGRLVASLDKDTIYSIAKLVSKSVASSLPLWYGSDGVESLIKYFESSINYTGARLPHRLIREGNTIRSIVIQPFNENGSAWARGFNTGLVENVLGYPPKIVEHANSIETIIEIKEST